MAVALLVASGCEREPTSYHDCILKKIKPGMSDAAVKLVTVACAQKFADDLPQAQATPESEALTPLEALALNSSARAGLAVGNYFRGTLYNSFEDRTLTEIEVKITTTIGGRETSDIYRTEVSIGPRSAGDFGFSILLGDPGAGYDWVLTGAKARKQG